SDARGWERIERVDQLVAAVAQRFRRHQDGEAAHPVWWRLYEEIAGQPVWRRRALPVCGALEGRNDPGSLSAEVPRALFGAPLTVSASRLESFAACPFQHFVRYGLRLAEPDRPGFDRAETGSFIHAALRRFTDMLKEQGT